MTQGKKIQTAQKAVDRFALYTLSEGFSLVRAQAFAAFDESVDMAVNLNIKRSHSVRDVIIFPHYFGNPVKVLVFCQGDKAEEARQSGADYVGSEDLIEKIKGGWFDFDVAVATPDLMPQVGKLGPLLGRRGLMPNPKTQTVTTDIAQTLQSLKKGRKEFRADKAGIIHIRFGKLSMSDEQLSDNAMAILKEISRHRPPDVKGVFIQSVSLSSTMGPGLRIDVGSLNL